MTARVKYASKFAAAFDYRDRTLRDDFKTPQNQPYQPNNQAENKDCKA